MSRRLRLAVEFLTRNKIAKNQTEIAEKMGVKRSTLSMAMSGYRKIPLEVIMDFCEAYPMFDIRWLLVNQGVMIYDGTMERMLARISRLEQELEAYKSLKTKDLQNTQKDACKNA